MRLNDDISHNHFSSDHWNLTGHIQPSIRLNRTGKRQMLPSVSLAAFNAIPLDAHAALLRFAVNEEYSGLYRLGATLMPQLPAITVVTPCNTATSPPQSWVPLPLMMCAFLTSASQTGIPSS
jgi:hypothetical protein